MFAAVVGGSFEGSIFNLGGLKTTCSSALVEVRLSLKTHSKATDGVMAHEYLTMSVAGLVGWPKDP